MDEASVHSSFRSRQPHKATNLLHMSLIRLVWETH